VFVSSSSLAGGSPAERPATVMAAKRPAGESPGKVAAGPNARNRHRASPRPYAPVICWAEVFGSELIFWCGRCLTLALGRGGVPRALVFLVVGSVPAGQPTGRPCRRVIAAVIWPAQGHRSAGRSRRPCPLRADRPATENSRSAGASGTSGGTRPPRSCGQSGMADSESGVSLIRLLQDEASRLIRMVGGARSSS
jgi:hypothetical protein